MVTKRRFAAHLPVAVLQPRGGPSAAVCKRPLSGDHSRLSPRSPPPAARPTATDSPAAATAKPTALSTSEPYRTTSFAWTSEEGYVLAGSSTSTSMLLNLRGRIFRQAHRPTTSSVPLFGLCW
jgi:hypothetical protein